MKQNLIRLSEQYVTALRKHLKEGPQASLRPALGLGCQAVALGVDTLELARIHQEALATLELSKTKNAFTKLAGIFFTAANTLIEETHHAARQTKVRLGKLTAALGERTEELAASNRQLKKGIIRRKIMEEDFADRGKHHEKCLEESLELQKRLRQLTHQVITVQEQERKKISRELQDEIAQTLLGINVRLLSLKQHARNNTQGLKAEITSTQRLLVKSARSVQLVADDIGTECRRPARIDLFP